MSETDPGPLPTSKMELSVTINGSHIYAKFPILASITHVIVIL